MNRAHRTLLLLGLAALLGLTVTACGDEATQTASGPDDQAATTDSDQAGGGDADADSDRGDDGDDGDEGDEGDATNGQGAAGQGLSVASPVYPLAWVAEQIAPGADVTLLTDQGEDPHDIELSPRGRELLEIADLVVYMGDLDYQPHVETAVDAATGRVVAFTDAVDHEALLTWDDGHDDDHSDDDHSDDDHSSDGHDDDHSNDDHDHGAYDPHAWFDAAFMAEFTEALGEAFAEVDPDAATDYTEHAEALAEEFMALDAEIDEKLGGACTHDYVVVSHEAYAYLLEPHGHRQEGVSGAGGHGPASPQRVAELADQIREDGIAQVLTEPVEGREDAEAVAQESGAELLEIYSLEVVDDEGHFTERGFLELLHEQAEAASEALSCE